MSKDLLANDKRPPKEGETSQHHQQNQQSSSRCDHTYTSICPTLCISTSSEARERLFLPIEQEERDNLIAQRLEV
jgi:hypothetical protein